MRVRSLSLVLPLTAIAFLAAGCTSTGSSQSESPLSPAQKEKALSEVERLTQLVERTDDPIQRSRHLMLIGSYYSLMHDPSSSLEAYEEARRLREAAGAYALARESAVMAASAMSAGGEPEKAIELLEEDLERHGEPASPEQSAEIHHQLARMYIAADRFDAAARSARIAAGKYRELYRREQEAEMLYLQAMALNRLDQTERAGDLVRRSYEFYNDRAEAYNDIEYELKAERMLNTAAEWGVDTSQWKPR
ncbi:MAG TPA: hypothetical protein VK973_13375 [Arenicellales bacterium]|nr:hypothetical protein [Arenicellales bacterium]